MPAEQWLLGDKYFLLLLVMLYAYDPPPPQSSSSLKQKKQQEGGERTLLLCLRWKLVGCHEATIWGMSSPFELETAAFSTLEFDEKCVSLVGCFPPCCRAGIRG